MVQRTEKSTLSVLEQVIVAGLVLVYVLLCSQLCEKFNGIYSLSKREGQVVLPDTFVPKVQH